MFLYSSKILLINIFFLLNLLIESKSAIYIVLKLHNVESYLIKSIGSELGDKETGIS